METLEYRGIRVEFSIDDPGQQVVGHFTNLDIADIGFGAYNEFYEEDAKHIIDDKLDTIKYFRPGGRLAWFTNGFSENRDIKLEFRSRICKVWLIDDPEQVDLDMLLTEATKICEELEAKRLASKNPGTYISDLMEEAKN